MGIATEKEILIVRSDLMQIHSQSSWIPAAGTPTLKETFVFCAKMREKLAPVKCIVQEKNANLDVDIVRRDRAIMYRVQPRKVLTVRNEALKWKRAPVTQVEGLINVALDQNGNQSSSKVVCVMFKMCLFV